MSIDTPQNIINRFNKPLWAIRSSEMYRLLKDLKNYVDTESCNSFGEYHHLVLKNDNKEQVMQYLQQQQHNLLITAVKRQAGAFQPVQQAIECLQAPLGLG
jgi:hypothetical protein